MNLRKICVYLLLTIFIIFGFYYRLQGISSNHSFWADEGYIASIARDLAQGEISLSDLLSTAGTFYQLFHVLLLTLSFIAFGATEFAARILPVAFGTVGIAVAFAVGKKFSNDFGGLIAAFLVSFSQLEIVYSTQARPYAALSTIMLSIVYCIQLLSEKTTGKPKKLLHLCLIILSFSSIFLHASGIFIAIIYPAYLLFSFKKQIILRLKNPTFSITLVIGFLLLVFAFPQIYQLPMHFLGKDINNTTYLRALFAREYSFISLPALFGLLLAFNKYRGLVIGLLGWIFLLLIGWNFMQYSHNIRYLVPFFSILFIFFAVFWANVGEKLFQKQSALICLAIIAILFIGGNKIARKPALYYSPNADLYGDVQNANYKDAFAFIEKEYPNHKDMVIFNDIIDAQRWYLTEKPDADAYFAKHAVPARPHVVNNVMEYGTLEEFLKEQSKFESGLLIVEDWESILPEDIKQYAKENMKLEYRVESLEVSPTDKWPIEIYSWGMEEK